MHPVVSNTIARSRASLGRLRVQLEHRPEVALFAKYSDSTMIKQMQFVDNLLLARSLTVDGAIVECGTWRGGMSAALAEAAPGRRSELFDSFEGLPAAGERDGDEARAWLESGYTLSADQASAEEAMRRSGSPDYGITKGWFDATVPAFAATAPSIALLRIDGDWYDSTMVCLQHLFPLVVDGGIVILDDYGSWEGCTRAVHDYLSREQRTEPVMQTRHHVVFLTKGSGYGALGWGE